MRLTLRLLGLEVLHIDASTDPDPEPECGCSLDGGTTVAYPIGFSLSPQPPYEHEAPSHIEDGYE